jgi:hypothetical protein
LKTRTHTIGLLELIWALKVISSGPPLATRLFIRTSTLVNLTTQARGNIVWSTGLHQGEGSSGMIIHAATIPNLFVNTNALDTNFVGIIKKINKINILNVCNND